MDLPIDAQALLKTLQLPPQDIDLLIFCASNKSIKVIDWVNSLKTTQTLKTCSELYQAIPQVVRLKTTVIERKTMLDTLFLAAYPAALTLGREFLNQPLALPQQAQKSAILGQSLLKTLAVGYLLCIQSYCDDKKRKSQHNAAIAECIFYALQCLALMQLRNQQLYSQASPFIWRYANSLFQLAKHFGVTDTLIKPHFNGLQIATPQNAYLRIIALAVSRLNQLTQVDMGHVFNTLETWTKALKLNTETPTFWINLSEDTPPTAVSRAAAPEGNAILTIDFGPLTQQLANLLEGEANLVTSGHEITIPAEINSPTAIHLENAWGRNVTRTSNRRNSEHTAEIVVGFQQCHSKLSGIDEFADFTGETKKQAGSSVPFLSNLLGSLTPSDTTKTNNTPTITPLRVTTQNISQDGYCFLWEGQQAIRIDAGDVIAIREHAKRTWSLGVIRWIRKLKNHSLLGVQLLSNKPIAVAASCNYEEGGFSDFMRAFILPSTHPQQGPTLLTANVLFKEHAKVRIKQDSLQKPTQGKIDECRVTTGRIKAFDLHLSDDETNAGPTTTQHRL